MLKETESIFIYNKSDKAINANFFNSNIYLTQKQIADLFETSISNISKHIKNIYNTQELAENATVSILENVVNRGFKGEVLDKIKVYNLDLIIAVGYRINSKIATEFRTWATSVLNSYIKKGFALDDNRFKQANKFDKYYFKELRERIKDIRTSEKMLYQQLKDIYSLSADYNYKNLDTLNFFASVQNKVLFAITGKTASEIIFERVSNNKENLGLTSFKNSPDGRITKQDLLIAKNYLNENEIKELKFIVNMFLDFAEYKTETEKLIFMKDWELELDKFLKKEGKEILQDLGSISHIQASKQALSEYNKYKDNLKLLEKANSIKEYEEDLKELNKLLKKE